MWLHSLREEVSSPLHIIEDRYTNASPKVDGIIYNPTILCSEAYPFAKFMLGSGQLFLQAYWINILSIVNCSTLFGFEITFVFRLNKLLIQYWHWIIIDVSTLFQQLIVQHSLDVGIRFFLTDIFLHFL